jgi:hypothetical protein
MAVTLAPGWWLDEQGLHFSQGERVEVTGSKTKREKTEFVAWEVRSKGRSLRLRDARGQPLWPSAD